MSTSIIISLISLLVAVIALIISIRPMLLQGKVHKITLENDKQEKIERSKAIFNCYLRPHTTHTHQLTIENIGQSDAKNIIVEIEEDPHINEDCFTHNRDLLKMGTSFTINLSILIGIPEVIYITLKWEDNYKVNNIERLPVNTR